MRRPTASLRPTPRVIQITKIMEGLNGRHRALGTHWWNPPHMIPLVEVVKTEWTDPALAQSMFDLLADAGKTPVMVEKDVPGFIGNRLQHALWREAISLVENGICDRRGRRYRDQGQLRAPAGGAGAAGKRRSRRHRPDAGYPRTGAVRPRKRATVRRPICKQLVDEGRLGMKAGAGISRLDERRRPMPCRARVADHLRKLEAILAD